MLRINKYLAQAGIASRRGADELIARGVVTIDGRRATAGEQVDPAKHKIRVNGQAIVTPTGEHVVIALNKPAGVVTTMRDERSRPSIDALLPPGRRLFPVGRLDAQTTGLLLCTSDGELCRKLSHPSFEVERRYRVVTNGVPDETGLKTLNASNLHTRRDGSAQFEMSLHRGANREIRRACAQLGLRVISLERIAYGPIKLGDLRPGAHRMLSERERRQLGGTERP